MTAASLLVVAAGLARRIASQRRRLGLPRRTIPGNRYRAFRLSRGTAYVREDFFAAGVYTNLRSKGGA